MYISARRTGRTTRMLQYAEKLAKEGKAVYVVCNTVSSANNYKSSFGAAKAQQLGIKFESISNMENSIDWKQMKLINAHENCKLLVDHWVIEQHFGSMLDLLHRFDVSIKVPPDGVGDILDRTSPEFNSKYKMDKNNEQ